MVFNICLERSFHFNYPCGTLCHLLLHPQLNYSRGEEVAALVTTLDFTDRKKITVPICGLIDPHIILLSTRWMMIHHVDILCKMQVRRLHPLEANASSTEFTFEKLPPPLQDGEVS